MKDAPISDRPLDRAGALRVPVEILLATRNNAAYLQVLLDSLIGQTVQDFQLTVSDDCSDDETVLILQANMARFRNPVHLTIRAEPSGSAAANFAGLMQASVGEQVFFCDADDVWQPDKLAVFLRRAAGADPAVPLFLFSDASIIDAAGTERHASYWAFKNTDPARCLTLSRLLVCTPMIGCASMMNRALVDLARDVPVGRATGHDWWALLVAASFGEVAYLQQKTVQYRIHGANSSRPMEISVRQGSRIARLPHEVRRRMRLRRRQALPLLEQFEGRLPAAAQHTIAGFLALERQSFFRRRVTMLIGGYTFPDGLRSLALMIFS